MFWYPIESLLSLILLYAIMGTLIEFRYSGGRRYAIMALAICVTFFWDSWNNFHGSGLADSYSMTWLTTFIPNFLSLLYLTKHRDGSFFFIYLTVSVIASIATFLSYILASLLPWRSDVFPCLFHTLILVVIYLISCRLFRDRFFEAARYQGKLWLLYCTLPIICIAAWAIYNSSQTRFFDIQHKTYLPYTGYIYLQDIPVFITLMISVVYTVSLILIIITRTYQAEKDRQEKAALSSQGKVLNERLRSLEERNESISIIRHDFRHHLSILSGLLENKEVPAAQKYLNQLNENLLQVKQESYCQNAVINAIISNFSAITKREAITLSVTVKLNKKISIDDMDIGIVLYNALENAYNACMKLPPDSPRFIELKFIQHKKQFVLNISNSFCGPVEYDIDGRPVSNREGHDLGGKSIFAFVRKYQASINYSDKDGVFCISLMFADTNTI